LNIYMMFQIKFFCIRKTSTISILAFNLLFLICFISISSGFSQKSEIKFDRISIEQGLSENVVLSLAQDGKGFIWVGTQDGLNRYDGNRVKVFKNNPDDPQSLSNSYVSVIFTDQDGLIWVGTAKGLNRFDSKNEKFIRYFHIKNNNNSISSNNITAIYQDQSGIFWVGTGDSGLNKFDTETGDFIRYQHNKDNLDTISNNNISTIFEDRSGILWVGTIGGGLNRLDKKTDQFFHYKPDPQNQNSISNGNISTIYEDSNNNLWIGTDGGGLEKFNKDSDQFVHFKQNKNNIKSISHNSIQSIHEDKTGILWIGTNGGGLNLYNPKTKRFVHHLNDPLNNQSLSTDYTTTIFEDKSGIIWIGSENGISKFDRFKLKFSHFKHHPDNPDGLSNNFVTAILQDQSGILWVGTQSGGLNKFDPQKNGFIHYKHDPNNLETISEGTIYSLVEDKKGRIWIGTQNGGLNRFNPETETFIHYPHKIGVKNSLSSNFVWPIYEDTKGFLWVGTWGGGLNKFNPETEQFFHYKSDPDNTNSLSNDQLSSIIEDSAGNIWVGTFQGLNLFNPDTGIFQHFKNDPDSPNSLSNNAAISLYEDSNGVLWIGTLNGLNRFNNKTATFSHYNTKDGLPNEVIASILEDKEGMLWISTFNGISRFDSKKEIFTNYNVDDGLQSKRFKANAHFKAADGQIFFGGINGFNAFYPETIKNNTFIPPVVLTDFQLFNRSIKPSTGSRLSKSISESNRLELSYKDSVFSLEFASLHYSAPEVIQYAYKLDGFDKEWLYTDARKPFATYTNLDGGTYIFRVKGTNSDGIWNEKSTDLKIVIQSQFWKTNWFYLLLFCIVFAIIAITVTYLQRLRHEIVERKRAENDLFESEKKYRDLIDTAPDLRYRTDMEGKIVFVSQSVFNLSGYTVEEAIGMKMAEEIYINPEERTVFLQAIQENGYIIDFEARLKRKDGTMWWASTNAHFQKDKDGNILGVEGVTRDITERKRNEDKLSLQSGIITRMSEGVSMSNMDNIIVYTNPAFERMFGYDSGEMIGFHVSTLNASTEKTPEEAAEDILKALDNKGTWDGEIQNIKKDGTFFSSAAKVAILDHPKYGKAFISVQTDISELKQTKDEKKELENKLQQAQKMESIGNLAGGIAHDFNNLLFPIIGMSEMLLEDLPEDSLEYENAEEIFQAGKRAGDLVNQILAFSRQSEHKMSPVRVQNVLKEVLKLSRSTIPANIEIHQNIQQNCGLVMADPTQIHQIGMNLITNAFHAVESKNGTIDIELKVVPFPNSLYTLISPLCSFTIPYSTASPRPVPLPCSFVVKYGSKIFWIVFSDIPIPLSDTDNLIYFPDCNSLPDSSLFFRAISFNSISIVPFLLSTA